MKKYYAELYSLVVIFIFGLIWALPLKSFTKFLLVQEGVFMIGSYSTSGVVLFSIFSGLISYIMVKSYQCLKGKASNVNFSEFAFIFTFNMVLTTILIFWGYPLLSFLVNGGINLYVIPYFSTLYEQAELKVLLTGNKETFLNSEKPQKGVLSDSNSELDTEIARSHHNVIIGLRELLSTLKSNNNVFVEINGKLSTLDFRTLLTSQALEAYSNDVSKHLLWVILDKHSSLCQTFIDNRIGLIKYIFDLKGTESWPEVSKALAEVEIKRQNLSLEYQDKISKINHNKGSLMSFKQFFDISNWYAKALSKEANYIENIISNKIRMDSIYSNGDFKNLFNKDYTEIKKTFSEQDSYLRRKISEAYEAQAANKN